MALTEAWVSDQLHKPLGHSDCLMVEFPVRLAKKVQSQFVLSWKFWSSENLGPKFLENCLPDHNFLVHVWNNGRYMFYLSDLMRYFCVIVSV